MSAGGATALQSGIKLLKIKKKSGVIKTANDAFGRGNGIRI